MNKAAIGASLFGLVALVGCTAQDSHPADPPPAVPIAEQRAADAVKPGFVGTRPIGSWNLVCRKLADNSVPPPPTDQPVKSSVINKGGHQMLDIRFSIPSRPCMVSTLLEPADRSERETVATFELRGPYGVLFLLFRARRELFPPQETPDNSAAAAASKTAPSTPPENSAPASVSLQYDGATLKAPLVGCGPFACFSRIKVRQEDEPRVLAAKDIAVELPPLAGKPPLRITLPAAGLAEAIGTMRKLEK